MSIPVIPMYAMPHGAALPHNKVQWQVDPARAVLLIHDMQEYFVRFYGADNPLLERLVANIVAIRAWAGEHGVPVVYTAQPREQSAQQRALLNDMWGPGLTTADPAQVKVVAALAPSDDDTVLVKWRYSAFQRSPLEGMMMDWNRNQLIIVGVYAHIGCMTTALDAFMRDIEPFMVADALGDFTQKEHDMALQYVAGRCGVVLDTAQVLQTARPAVTRDWLRAAIAARLDASEGPFDGDDNLLDFGLDSIQVMGLVAEWEKLGCKVRFEDLAEAPTLNAWWKLLERAQSPAPRLAA
jgi:bifunctional isochorismate lyase/aryl carrier protein